MADRGTKLFTINLLGMPISVNLVDYPDAEEEDVYGTFDSYNLTIEIDANSNFHHQRSTALHEIFHGLQEYLGLEETLEHKDVYSISQVLYAVIKDNPEFVKWLTTEPPENGKF